MRKIAITIELSIMMYGIYAEAAPNNWPMAQLPAGGGLLLAIVALAMCSSLISEKKLSESTESTLKIMQDLVSSSGRTTAVHENQFYEMWTNQIKNAKNNVDITHLGKQPPTGSHGKAQTDYFDKIKTTVRGSPAQFRRVERNTFEKKNWIITILSSMQGLKNFSLAIYDDPSLSEMPAAMSVCRIDNDVGWIVALAEQQSTVAARDILITNPQAVDLLRQYFQNRLWGNSTVLMESGTLTELGKEFIKNNADHA